MRSACPPGPRRGCAATSSARTATAGTGRRATTPRTNQPDRGRPDPMGALTLTPNIATWAIAALATLGVIVRPFSWPEAIWAVLGAGALVALGLLAPATAWEGVLKGTDVYLFLVGMMLMSEVARKEGLFDWLAGIAVRAAKG